MATGDNMMDLALQITADPSQAEAAIGQVRESVQALQAQSQESLQAAETVQAGMGTQYQTMAQALKAYGDDIASVAEQYKLYGVAGAEAAAEIKAAFQATDEQTKQAMADAQAWLEQVEGTQGAAPGAAPLSATAQQEAYRQTAQAAQESAAVQQEAYAETSAAATAAAEASAAAAKQAAEPVIVYDRAMRGATATAANWEQAADAELAKLRETMGVSAEAGRAQAASSERAIGAEEQHVATIAELRAQYAGLAEDAARLQAMPFLSAEEQAGLATDRELMAGIQAEAEGLGGTIERVQQRTNLWHTMNQGVIGDFRLMRYSMYAFTTPLMFSYLIPQIAQMVEGIKEGIDAMQGFDAAAQKAFADIVKGSDEALTKFQGLTTAQKIWQGQILEAQTQQRINNDIAIREQLEHISLLKQTAGFVRTLIDLGSQDYSDMTTYYAQFSVQAGALKDELQQEALLAKQHQALAALEKQLHQEMAKTGKAAKDAADWQQKWDEVIAVARVHLPPYIAQIDRLRAAIAEQESGFAGTLQILKQYQDLLRQGFPSPAQLGFEVPNAQATGVMGQQIQQVQQLTAAQRLALPTERELALANQELARDYPNLTAAERAEWAQVMLTSSAYRQHIDEASRVKNSNATLAGSFNALAMQVRTAFSEMAGQITGWGGVATRVFDQVFSAVTRQIEIEQRHAGVAQLSAAATAKATVDGLKQIAVVKAVVDFAKGLEELAEAFMGHPGAAAAAVQDFAAAALWGTVGAFQVASMAGAFQPGSSGSKAVATAGTATTSASSTPPALASGSASAAARSQSQPGTLIVQFHGPVYGGPSGVNELIHKISDAVTNNREKLVASHTIFGKAIA